MMKNWWCSGLLWVWASVGLAWDSLPVEKNLSFLEDKGSRLTLDRVLAADYRFKGLPTGYANFGYSKSSFWIRVPLPEGYDAKETTFLEIEYPLHSIRAYFRDANGIWQEKATGESMAFSERPFQYRFPVIPIPAGTEGPIFLQIQSQSSVQAPLTLWSSHGISEKIGREQFYFGFYYGLLAIMALFNLLISYFLRDRAALSYALFLSAYGVLQLQINRLAAQFLWPDSSWANLNSVPPVIGATLLFMTLFASSFLRIKKTNPRLNRVLVGCGILAMLSGLTIIFGSYHFTIFLIFATVPLASLMTLIVSALRVRGSRPAALFLISWTPFVLGLWALMAKALGLLSNNFFTTYGIQVASAVGILLFSISLADRFTQLRSEKEKMEREAALAKQLYEQNRRLATQAEQVAHDIRSPLTALDVAVSGLINMPENERLLIRGAVTRIKDITNQLSQKAAHPEALQEEATDDSPSSHWLWGLIEPVLSEKRLQYYQQTSVKLDGYPSREAVELFSNIEGREFKRIVSNLINNAYEAIEGEGRIRLSLIDRGYHNCLMVEDTGKGIPAEVLPKLMSRGASFGKSEGTGLGLFHAKEAVESWGGRIEIESTEGKGTKISLLLPKSQPPAWSVGSIRLRPDDTVVVVDDDPSIYDVWKSRFSGIKGFSPPIYFSAPQSFQNWYQGIKNEKVIVFCDYDFNVEGFTGLDLISELNIAHRSYLVTSRFDDPDIQKRCLALNLSLIPKGMAPLIAIAAAVEEEAV